MLGGRGLTLFIVYCRHSEFRWGQIRSEKIADFEYIEVNMRNK